MTDLAGFSRELRDTARSLRSAGDTDLSRQLQKNIGDAAKPVMDEIRAGLPAYMPNRYAGVLGRDLRLTTSKRLSGAAGAKVLIKASTKSGTRKIGRLNKGMLAHPFFGDRKRWYNQKVTAGFFTKPIDQAASQVRDKIRKAMDTVAGDAARR